jgi:hypothetical protein
MKRPRSNFALNMLILWGVILGSIGIVLHYWEPTKYEKLHTLPVVVGFAMAVFGAFWKDPARAQRATHGVTEAGGEVVKSVVALRLGKRANDPVVEVAKSRPADDPDAQPTVEVKVTQPGAPSVEEIPPGGAENVRD